MRPFARKRNPQPWKGLGAGLAGGVAGTLAMTAAQLGMGRLLRAVENRHQAEKQGEEEQEEREGREPATAKMAGLVAEKVFHRSLDARQREQGGQVVHYGFGASIGTAYGLAAEYWPPVTKGTGLPFGAGLMLTADEIAIPALRLAPPPTRQPASIHLYALAAHLVYGAACEATRRQVRRRLG